MVEQYDVINVDLNPVRGNEKGNYRPCVIVSDSEYNKVTNLVWVIPITKREIRYPTDIEVITKKSAVEGTIDAGQIRTLDLKSRDYKVVDTLENESIEAVKDILRGILNF